METRYKVVVDVGDGSVISDDATGVRVYRELEDGDYELVISLDQPSRLRKVGREHVEEVAG